MQENWEVGENPTLPPQRWGWKQTKPLKRFGKVCLCGARHPPRVRKPALV